VLRTVYIVLLVLCEVLELSSVQVQYMVDMTAQRHVLQLGSTEVQDYPAGKSSMHFSASAIDISGIKRSWLNNVGLLLVWSLLLWTPS